VFGLFSSKVARKATRYDSDRSGPSNCNMTRPHHGSGPLRLGQFLSMPRNGPRLWNLWRAYGDIVVLALLSLGLGLLAGVATDVAIRIVVASWMPEYGGGEKYPPLWFWVILGTLATAAVLYRQSRK